MGTKSEIPVIGVTGGMGTGKSTVARFFKKLGAVVLDADRIAHTALKEGTDSYEKIINTFGRGILGADGRILRRKLAQAVFSSKISLKKLCGIVHPIVLKKIDASIKSPAKSSRIKAIVIDAPLLIEAGLHKKTDYVVVVKCARAAQIRRAVKNLGLTVDEAMKRINIQMPLSGKIKKADYVISNDGNERSAEEAAKIIWKEIKKSWKKVNRQGKSTSRKREK